MLIIFYPMQHAISGSLQSFHLPTLAGITLSSVGRQHLFVVPGRLQVYVEEGFSVSFTLPEKLVNNVKNMVAITIRTINGKIKVLETAFFDILKKEK